MKTPEITIYGYGYVGKGVYEFLKTHYEIQLFDPFLKDSTSVVSDWKKVQKTSFAVICVPTPMKADGTCDTSIVEEVLRKSNHDYYLIKSTVVPGTTAELVKKTKKKIAFSPEYMGEGRYEIPFWQNMPHPTNMKLHSFHIFGGEKKTTKKWVEVWQKVGGWYPTYSQTDSTTAELVKYMENAFLATKKIFCDEFYDIAETLGVDYTELKELWLLDGRMGRSMTIIYPNARGFSGKCLPKDVSAITKFAEKKGANPRLLKQVLAINKDLRKRN